MAISTATRVASRAISSDTGMRVAISSLTGLPDHIDVPKSPLREARDEVEELQQQRAVEAELGVAVGDRRRVDRCRPTPSRTTQMSPGMRRIRMNTSAAAPIRVGIDSSRRFRM